MIRTLNRSGTVARILIVDDDPGTRELVSFALAAEGHETLAVEDGAGAIRGLSDFQPELIVLDFNLPDVVGADLCAEIRLVSRVPLLFLTARAGETDKARGFRAGADDYLVKPFSPRELGLRVGALLRRSAWNATPTTTMTVGDLELDATAKTARRGGVLLGLSPMEFDILHALASTPGAPWPPERLARRLGLEVSTPIEAAELIRVKMSRLRRKVEPDPTNPTYLLSHRGSGYMLAQPPAEAATDVAPGAGAAKERSSGEAIGLGR